MLTGLFTGLSTARKALKRVQELEEWVASADRALRKQAELIEELRAGHLKLRGRFYATRPQEEDHGDSRESRRAAAFKKHGITPGRPVNLES